MQPFCSWFRDFILAPKAPLNSRWMTRSLSTDRLASYMRTTINDHHGWSKMYENQHVVDHRRRFATYRRRFAIYENQALAASPILIRSWTPWGLSASKKPNWAQHTAESSIRKNLNYVFNQILPLYWFIDFNLTDSTGRSLELLGVASVYTHSLSSQFAKRKMLFFHFPFWKSALFAVSHM